MLEKDVSPARSGHSYDLLRAILKPRAVEKGWGTEKKKQGTGDPQRVTNYHGVARFWPQSLGSENDGKIVGSC